MTRFAKKLMLSQWIRVVGFPMHPSISRSKFESYFYIASLAPLGLDKSCIDVNVSIWADIGTYICISDLSVILEIGK